MRLHHGAVMLALACATVAFSAAGIAQTQTTPTASGTSASQGTITGHTTFLAKDGVTVTVRSLTPQAQQWATPPSFASLDANHNGSISEQEAGTYPPLANAFAYADLNHNGRISQSEYAWWLKQP